MSNVPCTHHVTEEELAAARASVAEMSRQISLALAKAGPRAMLVAWLSDFHFFAPRDYGDEDLGSYAQFRDPRAIARLAFEELKALRPTPDLLIYGGDLTNSSLRGEGHDDEFETLREVLDAHAPANIPSLFILGNHDHGDYALSPAFHRCLGRWRRNDWPAPVETDDVYYAAERLGWRFIAMDTRHSGPLSARQRTWLADQLRDERSTIVLQHRPFLKCGNPVDQYRFIDPETYALITSSPSVRAVFSAHTHKATAWRVGDQPHFILPALAYGIDDVQGWGCLILHPEHPPRLFAKALAVQFNDDGTKRDGSVRELPIAPYDETD